jgi:ferric-dicitrate binding protein FerR (iron transport regulator)
MKSRFADIIILSKQIASSLLKDKNTTELDDSNIFSSEDKEYILNQLTDKEAIKQRLEINRSINSKNDFDKVKAQINVPKRRRLKRYSIAAAAILTLGIYTFFENYLALSNEKDKNSGLTHNNSIQTGTDKASLVLEDGSVINLEKGSTLKFNNFSSNGNTLILSGGNEESKIAYNYLNIPRGGQFKVILSDSTVIWLNSESKLRFPETFIPGEDRIVELVYGEAYFDVVPSNSFGGSTFKVNHNNQMVEVTGTEFNIKAYPDDLEVHTTLIEGQVYVRNEKFRQILKPNQQSRLDRNTQEINVIEVDALALSSWKRGMFSFRNMPLKEIMKVVSRWYDIEIVFQNAELEIIPFRGVLGKNQNIEDLLSNIKSLSIINDYEIEDRRIILK